MLAQQGMMRPFNVAGQRPAVMGYPQGMATPMLGKGFGQQMPGFGKGAPGQPVGPMGQPMGPPMKGGPPGGVPGAPVVPGGPGSGRPTVPREQQLTAQMLAQAPPGMQKQMLGEKLYPAVSRLQPELAGKITGRRR